MDKDIKAAIDGFAKNLEKNEKLLEAVPDLPKADSDDLPEAVQKAMGMMRTKGKEAVEAYAAMEKEMEAFHAEMEAAMIKALAECKAAADKATKAYMDAIKNTDGATSAKPSIVKVLQATGKAPDPDAIAKAVEEMRKHKAEMEKAYGKDKAQTKMLAAFTKDLDTAAKALGSLI